MWHKLGKREYNLCLFDCIYKFYPEEKKSWSHGVRTNIKNVRFTWNVYLYQQTAKSIIKKTYIIVLRTVYIFLSMHIDYTKLTFEYFRREINRRRTTGHEVAAVVCIHPWKFFVHIQTCFWNRIEHVKRWYIRNVLSKKRLDNLKLFFLCNTLFLYVYKCLMRIL